MCSEEQDDSERARRFPTITPTTKSGGSGGGDGNLQQCISQWSVL
jgi:hypothetical protein